MGFPEVRMRRLRRNEAIRRLVRRTELSVDHLVMPLFVRPGTNVARPIGSMPGQCQFSVDRLVEEVQTLADAGIPAVLLFGIPSAKDACGSQACAEDGVVQEAVRAIRKSVPGMLIITDVCLCEYTDHGHCGLLVERGGARVIDNDRTLESLCRMALSHVRAGAALVAPSDMMDGRVGAIRRTLDREGFEDTGSMSYAAKFASGFYGPFREAAESPPAFGDRRSHQMDPGNAEEALREVDLDVQEGADIVMVKPALAYLDIIRRVRDRFDLPVAAYSVSGEYSAIKAASTNGWLDERTVALEMLTGIRRAGADIVITYWAADVARWLVNKDR